MDGRLRILLLEDDPADADLITRLLKRSGLDFDVANAGDKEEFLAAISNSSFDVVLADHRLPQFSSLEALQIIKQRKLDVVFILVTGTVSEEFAVNIIQQGADDYLLKNNLNRLPAAIQQSIEKRRMQHAKEAAEDELKNSREQLRHLFFYTQNIREEERTRIAREIHDELGQQLTGLKMDVFWLRKKLDIPSEEIQEKINGMIALIDSTVRSVRKISADLRPGILDDLGLIAALDWQSNEFQKRTDIACHFHSETNEQNIEKKLATGIFRIFQETLTNVARHAGASEINCTVEQDNGAIILTINDNGKGFDQSELPKKKTLGIVGMRERAMMMGGELKINSTPGKGTTTTLRVPLQIETTTKALTQ